ncbi:beta-glucosidase [Ginsengibacter hankyongi]|uniref:Beta-glucosidase n=1 Tax=Ginsengibacter hankyongi TaxID=2607284 RepID=A0A5J5IGJ5_9BACT|nr:glucoamylase family protein [Ginsengibacter hankyongi]KAA9038200.1 beta-glucosidase [Ginsengibacter hankyongi]
MKYTTSVEKIKCNTLLGIFITLSIISTSCGKKAADKIPVEPPPPSSFSSTLIMVDGKQETSLDYNINTTPVIKFSFSAPIDHASVGNSFSFAETSGSSVSFNTNYSNGDSVVVIQPSASLKYLSKYLITVSTGLKSKAGGSLKTTATANFVTQIDSTDKFARISDDALLDLAQRQTFKYFWDFGHPTSGMARERNTSGDVVTTGGTGFGVMSIIVGISRGFITRAEGLQRINTIVNFLKNNCTRYHGAFSHWINGATGATVPFSQFDDGGDLVETSLLMQGLLCARQYFNTVAADEVSLRTNINTLWNGVEWSWFRQNSQNVLYWHWSPNYNFQINMPIRGWDEALIVYALAASSNTDSIPRAVYDNGWALNGGIKNGNTYYGVQLPLGPNLGGPLFFSHYSFLGINPHDLTDAYADYFTQNTNHSLINYNYCVANPNNFFGYSSTTWGLTASDDNISGYKAHAPDNDDGVITPSAAISSLPYTPVQSMNALKFFYYTLGDKIWSQYGFVDAFNLKDLWFANSFLAIDQGPEIVMIENYRSNLLWNLFMSCPEIKRGMKQLGFQSPKL